MATNQQRDLRLVLAGFFQSVDLVSSFPGKLRIVHLCASLTWWLEKHAYAIAACSLTTNFKVALQVESTIFHFSFVIGEELLIGPDSRNVNLNDKWKMANDKWKRFCLRLKHPASPLTILPLSESPSFQERLHGDPNSV